MSGSRGKKSKLEALAELKRTRAGGSRTIKEEKDTDIYDVVSEDQYKRIVKGRLQKDDFVIDDGVDGYQDNGMEEEWENDGYYESDEEIEQKKNTAKSKGKPKAPPPPAVAPSINDYRKKVSAEEESDFMNNLFNTMDSMPAEPVTKFKSRKRKNSPVYSDQDSSPAPYRGRYDNYADTSSDGPMDDFYNAPSSDDLVLSPKKKQRTDTVDMTPATRKMEQMDMESIPVDDFDYDASFDDIDASLIPDDDEIKPAIKVEPMVVDKPLVKPRAEENAAPSWLSVYDSLTLSSVETLGSLAPSTAGAGTPNIDALEEDGSLRFYWLDYLEHEGNLYFIGKLKDKTTGGWVSCCVTVEGLERNLFVLPRQKRAEEGEDGQFYDTDEVPSQTNVYRDFDAIRQKASIGKFKGKFVQ
ncbi:dna polymerase alpha catalytic subunit [Moniliophthora roreri MCA 2997]|uniref:Dna polymerase alpha catalytic subunit n=2 Tax=Moniliophthora roreri TaxID=221103 RepID=V2X4Y1_MONRO|nr:dna polymerase alpha catalytic subunit [Moniliophthora roreri MCA 2997]